MAGGWGLARRAILSLSANPMIARAVTRYGAALGAYRFVAGETLDEALAAVRALNAEGMRATLDCLGEAVTSGEAARRAASTYLEALDRIAAAGADSHVSLKLTQFGLDIDPALCRANLEAVLERARLHGNFVRIDMEDSRHTQATIDLYKAVRQKYDNVGIVIQAYLYRSEADVRELAALGANLRLCKGAYNEPASVAFPRKRDVDANYRRLAEFYLLSGNFLAAATHDEALIEHVIAFAAAKGVPRGRFEFQMLYGIRRDLQRRLVARGFGVRVYVPFGTEWYAYFMRRLAERPANLAFFLRHAGRS